MSNLKDQLLNLEAKHTGPDGIEIRQSREVLMGAIGKYNYSRYELGRALRAYKAHFKVEHGWVAAAKIIAVAINRDERTVFRILDDYEHASQLPPIVLEVMQEQNIDPAAGKHAGIVENLLEMPVPDTREEAAAAVAGALRASVAQKKGKKLPRQRETDLEAFAKKVVKQFEDRYRSALPSERDEEVQYVLELLVNTLRVPIVELRQFSRPALVPKPRRKNAA